MYCEMEVMNLAARHDSDIQNTRRSWSWWVFFPRNSSLSIHLHGSPLTAAVPLHQWWFVTIRCSSACTVFDTWYGIGQASDEVLYKYSASGISLRSMKQTWSRETRERWMQMLQWTGWDYNCLEGKYCGRETRKFWNSLGVWNHH